MDEKMKARYQILAMVTDKKALGLSLNNGRPISVEGNPHMYYEGPEDMERFAQYIKNEYSINDFDDDDFALIIVDCGADCAAAKSLHAKTLTAKCSSLIEAEYVLPFIAAKKRAIKKGEEFTVTIADAAYTLRADDTGRIDCVRCTAGAPPPENALSLELADFTALFFADASVFGRDEDALKQKDAEIAELKADAERQIAEIETQHEQKRRLNMAVGHLSENRLALSNLANIVPSECWSGPAGVACLSSYIAFLLSLLVADLINEFDISPDDIDGFISNSCNDDEITELMNNATSTDERAVFSNCLADIDVLRKANALPADERNADELANAAIAAAKHTDAALDIARGPLKEPLDWEKLSDSDKLRAVFFNALTCFSQNAVTLAECVLQEKE